MTVAMTLRLPETDVQALDDLVAEGRYPDRSTAVRAAIHELLRFESERRLAEEFQRAYDREPETDDERAELAAAMALTARRIRDEERGR
jgi:Arc/MetJ-type ribon-helix-helix transcriptional regulator